MCKCIYYKYSKIKHLLYVVCALCVAYTNRHHEQWAYDIGSVTVEVKHTLCNHVFAAHRQVSRHSDEQPNNHTNHPNPSTHGHSTINSKKWYND